MPKRPYFCSFLFALAFPLTAAAGAVDISHDAPDEVQFAPSTTRAFDHTGAYLTTETRPDGSISTKSNGSFQNVTVARMGPGGKIETYCTTSEEDARNWMARQDGAPANVPLSKSPEDLDR